MSIGPRCGFVGTQFFWVGPGELVVLDVVRTGRIGTEAVVLSLVLLLSALTGVTAVRLGVRAAVDLVGRLLFLPTHAWSAAVVLLDVVVVAAAWYAAGHGKRAR
ncbi:MAG TPA: hypothetical protein VGL47_20150 [Amycolatopsis sp.]|uniref:Uncharacterized protein n=1 Tax=Amycolatopsis nalaikhensis TaxID=715472 RepID=A0ABY8XH20_9PSEU|nr:hypothetical protein [Amycolatopsis sp. 2-2]WIV54907.1 hypothetical protein QP939_39710 [Amycolatopsis sp. 2-2]